ncbi:MAG: hypothetical protein KAI79_13370 [Bacteroidales bacterium]|nr:hypothetical protein [Bacteroidales bacterium]
MEKITLEEALKLPGLYPITQHPDYQMDIAYDIDDVKDLIKEIYKSFEENREYSEAEIASWNGMGK